MVPKLWVSMRSRFLAFESKYISIEYRLISKKGEGTFSEVLKAQSIKTGKYVAIKCMKNHFDTIEQVSRRFLVNLCLLYLRVDLFV